MNGTIASVLIRLSSRLSVSLYVNLHASLYVYVYGFETPGVHCYELMSKSAGSWHLMRDCAYSCSVVNFGNDAENVS